MVVILIFNYRMSPLSKKNYVNNFCVHEFKGRNKRKKNTKSLYQEKDHFKWPILYFCFITFLANYKHFQEALITKTYLP